MNSCYGALLPAKTPQAVIAKLNTERVRILRLPEVRAKLESQRFDVMASGADDYERYVRTDMARWAKALKEAGINPEQARSAGKVENKIVN